MNEQEKQEIEEFMKRTNALAMLVAGMMAVLDDKIPDFRKELKGAIERQQGGNPSLKAHIDLALSIIDGLRHFVRNYDTTRWRRPLDWGRSNINAASCGEVRESGLTGVTRNHVSPCGSGGSNPPLSARQSGMLPYIMEKR